MRNPLTVLSGKVVGGLEGFFCWYGRKVASYPWVVLAICLVATGLSAIGVIRYRTENNAFKLWIPDNSDFVINNEWLEKNAPPDVRFNSYILAAPDSNILTRDTLIHLQNLQKKAREMVTGSGLSWPDVCRQVSVFPGGGDLPPLDFDDAYPDLWCSLLGGLKTLCLERSILELWPQDFDFSQMSQDEIIEWINKPVLVSSVLGTPVNASDYLGGRVVREGGADSRILGAEATFIQWFGRVNTSLVSPDDISASGTGEVVDPNSLEWEEELKNLLLEDQGTLATNGLEGFVNVGRSYSDVAGETIVGDAFMMPIGFMIVFVYVVVMLGKFTCTEQRALLALGGLLCIGLTIGVMYGLCSAFGLFYGPMHNVIPFLLLGIGIDDMFVIMQCYDNLALSGERSGNTVHDIGLTMRHAGVAITVTSFTDFIVFALGATTVLPALRSFCLWCSVGIVAVYLFQATLFTAFLALDCRRLKANRNGLCPCYRHRRQAFEENPNQQAASVRMSFSQRIFDYLGRVILSWPGMIVVLVAAAGLTAGGIYGLTQLEQKFDPIWFLPPTSYVAQWFGANAKYFPTEGESVTVYFTEIDWPTEAVKIGQLEDKLRAELALVARVDSWHDKFSNFLTNHTKYDDFADQLTYYLFTPPNGFADQQKFRFINESAFACGQPAPPLLLSTIGFTHKRLDDRDEQIAALHRIKELVAEVDFSGNVFPMAREYSNWETNEVITTELFRNLGLALACVFVTTLVLLADILGSIYVLGCVLLSLVDLCGYMHFWGLTVDVVSSVNIIIAIGLCVDYSAHICHTFLTIAGSRRERAAATLIDIGPAVLNGGVSTFIAFILLVTSDSHVFSSFFKIFFLVVVFGLFHGLLLLPVILRLAGPSAYASATEAGSGHSEKQRAADQHRSNSMHKEMTSI